MQYDLASVCREARARIDVPSVPLNAIRHAAGLPRARKPAWFTAVIASASMAAVAVGAATLGTHIAFEGSGKVLITSANLHGRFVNPTAADVDAAVRGANFPVTLPAGLPSGTKLESILGGDSVILLRYDLPGAWRASHHVVWIALANPSTIIPSATAGKMQLRLTSAEKPIHWRVGGEEVIIAMHNAMTPAELARFQAAMRAAATVPH